MVTQKKVDCTINLTVNSAESDFKNGYDLSVTLESSKKIVGESLMFHLSPETPKVDINHTIQSTAKFSHDKKANKYEKEVGISLGYFGPGNQRHTVGTCKFNLGPMVDKPEVQKTMTFTNFSGSTETCKITLTFKVNSGPEL